MSLCFTLMTLKCFCFAIFSAMFLVANGQTSSRDRGISNAERQTIIDEHIKYRRREGSSNMKNMVYDQFLEDVAQDWADQCFEDIGLLSRAGQKFPAIGQNFVSFGGRSSWPVLIQRWYRNRNDYNFTTADCSGFDCAFYLQIVWAETEAIGCGFRFCDSFHFYDLEGRAGSIYYYVCVYAPGYVPGIPPFRRGIQCSACESGVYTCFEGGCRHPCTDEDCYCVEVCEGSQCESFDDSCTCTCAVPEFYCDGTCIALFVMASVLGSPMFFLGPKSQDWRKRFGYDARKYKVCFTLYVTFTSTSALLSSIEVYLYHGTVVGWIAIGWPLCATLIHMAIMIPYILKTTRKQAKAELFGSIQLSSGSLVALSSELRSRSNQSLLIEDQ